MWELIVANKRKSIVLFMSMGFCLFLLGYFIGSYFSADNGWLIGISIAFLVWIIMSLISYYSGDSILLSISHAQKVNPQIHPRLYNVVEEMKIAANLPAMPKIYIIPESAPNAFAVGRNPEKSAIAVTAGLLSKLNRDELQGVIAHEMSHIMNRDILFMTFSGVMLGSIVFLSHIFLRSLWFSGGGRRFRSKSSGKAGGQAQLIIMAASILFAILAPLIAQILYFAISRKREYLADATAIRLTRYPEGLASALEKISYSEFELKSANKATAALYIINPLKKDGMSLSNLSSTHPPIDKRIEILRKISGSVDYINYQRAFAGIAGGKGHSSVIIPSSGMRDIRNFEIRKNPMEKQVKKQNQVREVGDLIRAINKYAFIPCACGLKIKAPPDFKNSKIKCPKCGTIHTIPVAELSAISEAFPSSKENKKKEIDPETFVYKRKTKGWESFTCPCGSVKQISPLFSKSHFFCNECERKIKIINAGKQKNILV